MAGYSFSGPLGVGADACMMDEGTLSRGFTPAPGSVGVGGGAVQLNLFLRQRGLLNPADEFPFLSTSEVEGLFVTTAHKNVREHYPRVTQALKTEALTEPELVFAAIATIAAETAGFVPISEYPSRYNSSNLADRTTYFDLYEPDTSAGDRLGNTEKGDGAKFKGRGFIQLTGRDNYETYGKRVNADLTNSPDLANDPDTAARILAIFLADKKNVIQQALTANPVDYARARKAVNGGSHGLDRFTRTYQGCIAAWKRKREMFAAMRPEELMRRQCLPVGSSVYPWLR